MKPILQKSFMGLQECEILCQYTKLRRATNRMVKRKQSTGTVWESHGTALTDSIGLTYLHRAQDIFKKDLSLSSSMIKVWNKGCAMGWHLNKWEFEYVVCIQISDHAWPIGFAHGQDNPVVEGLQYDANIITPIQGDAVFFNGAQTYHGRKRLQDDHCITLCLYYVTMHGHLDSKAGRKKYGDEYKTRIELHGEIRYDA